MLKYSFFLCFDHVGWSKLLLITPPNGQMCLLSIERKMFVWIWRVFRITKSNLLYICWYDLYPFSAEARLQVHLCLNSLKHTLELSPLKDFNSQAQYLKSYPYFLSWALLSTVSSNFTKYCRIYFWNETWALWSSPSLNIWATFILLLNQAHSILGPITARLHFSRATLISIFPDIHTPQFINSDALSSLVWELNLGPLELSKFSNW